MNKMKKILTVCFLLLCAMQAQAQIKIESTGRVIVGPDYGNNFDLGNALSMSIQGPQTLNNNAGSKLGFGDFGRVLNSSPGGWNVFIGEYGNNDSDTMWLHGKRGIRLTSVNGDNVLVDFGCNANSRTVFYNGIRTGQIMVSSEDGFKSNLTPVNGAMSRLLQLSSVSYRYILPREYAMTTEGRNRLSNEISDRTGTVLPLTGKDREDSVRMARTDSLRAVGSTLYGFVTSDFQQMFPELVETDDNGNSYVDYIGLIPVIVAAISEQQRTIELLMAQLQECCESNNSGSENKSNNGVQPSLLKPLSKGDDTQSCEDSPVLYQNTPNPFNRTTVINFHIPEHTATSTLYVFSLNGTLMQAFPIATIGDGCVSINGSTLSAGMYVYTLVVDGQIIDSKRMILTN